MTESSVPTQRYAPEPMYKKDVHSETQLDECNGARWPSRQGVEELELQSSDGGVEPPQRELKATNCWQKPSISGLKREDGQVEPLMAKFMTENGR